MVMVWAHPALDLEETWALELDRELAWELGMASDGASDRLEEGLL